eukprot:CAMPEP_0183727790 /NCGR_PEP_ID=MMETSP0737-20130205/26409_1 /TAXON_ID=385413 /ORGANISM="Thalassiosira miniscula, Strain CCMP1093" /LENGTH=384 /DNA_ID=CAMNT_0025959517 /DNA_START=142 /DNA_END=1293 /DNA_ORIENTATION=+
MDISGGFTSSRKKKTPKNVGDALLSTLDTPNDNRRHEVLIDKIHNHLVEDLGSTHDVEEKIINRTKPSHRKHLRGIHHENGSLARSLSPVAGTGRRLNRDRVLHRDGKLRMLSSQQNQAQHHHSPDHNERQVLNSHLVDPLDIAKSLQDSNRKSPSFFAPILRSEASKGESKRGKNSGTKRSFEPISRDENERNQKGKKPAYFSQNTRTNPDNKQSEAIDAVEGANSPSCNLPDQVKSVNLKIEYTADTDDEHEFMGDRKLPSKVKLDDTEDTDDENEPSRAPKSGSAVPEDHTTAVEGKSLHQEIENATEMETAKLVMHRLANKLEELEEENQKRLKEMESIRAGLKKMDNMRTMAEQNLREERVCSGGKGNKKKKESDNELL